MRKTQFAEHQIIGILKSVEAGHTVENVNHETEFLSREKAALVSTKPGALVTPESLKQSLSIDFMHNTLVNGRRFRIFNIVDDFNRGILAIEIEMNIPVERVVRVLDGLWQTGVIT